MIGFVSLYHLTNVSKIVSSLKHPSGQLLRMKSLGNGDRLKVF